MSIMAIDNPKRWWLFMQNETNRAINDDINYCPCGTRGSCMVCAGASEALMERWLAVLHPLKWIYCKVTRKRFY